MHLYQQWNSTTEPKQRRQSSSVAWTEEGLRVRAVRGREYSSPRQTSHGQTGQLPTSTSNSEPCCKGTDRQRSATNGQAHNLYGQQVNTEHLPYNETEHGRRKRPSPGKQRQPEVCLTEQKLFKLLGAPAQGKAYASLNRNSKARYKIQGTAAEAEVISSSVELYCKSRMQQTFHRIRIS